MKTTDSRLQPTATPCVLRFTSVVDMDNSLGGVKSTQLGAIPKWIKKLQHEELQQFYPAGKI